MRCRKDFSAPASDLPRQKSFAVTGRVEPGEPARAAVRGLADGVRGRVVVAGHPGLIRGPAPPVAFVEEILRSKQRSGSATNKSAWTAGW